MLTQFKIEEPKCCGRTPKVLKSHESMAFYECKKCGKKFYGEHQAKIVPQLDKPRKKIDLPPQVETGRNIVADQKKPRRFWGW